MKRSKFNLSNYKLLSCNMGNLVPVGMTEVLPGDTVQQATSMMVRAAPLATPPMHPVKMKVHHWFVPYRLLWDNWESFITGGMDGMDASVFPTISFSGAPVAVKSLADYFGVPNGYAGEVSALPFRAYALIYNQWYRDQDLMSELAFSKADGPDAITNRLLQSGAWEKDYFTTARPWEQKGPTVTLPLGTSAPVIANGAGNISTDVGADTVFRTAAGGGGVTQNLTTGISGQVNSNQFNANVIPRIAAGTQMFSKGAIAAGLLTDLSAATSVSVNALREALAVQRFEEARARYGSRYTEYLRYLGIRSSDARLQRPEYLGGGVQTLQFSEVLQTGQTTADPNGVGQLYGHGIGALKSNRYRRFFEEHGVIISLCQVQPKTIYADGLPRMFNRRQKEDFWQKELEHIGQQPVLNKEVRAVHATPDGVFGYQDRYDEYRRSESSIAGEFRTTLNDWHFARLFANDPVLNGSFVTSNPTKRPFQVTDPNVDSLLVMAYHQIVARRMLSASGSSYIL